MDVKGEEYERQCMCVGGRLRWRRRWEGPIGGGMGTPGTRLRNLRDREIE